MIRTMRTLAAGAVLALSAVSGGCAGYQDGYGGWGWNTPSEVRGRVEGVQTRLNTIQLRRDNGGRVVVRYDRRTEVDFPGRRGSAEALDPGDYVSMRVSRDNGGRLYARQVHVRREAPDVYRGDRDRDRRRDGDDRRGRGRVDDRWEDRRRDDRRDDGEWSSLRSAEGRVGRVDRSRRRFELRTGRGTVWVSVPGDLERADGDRFRRLRTGDFVYVTGRYVARDRFELERFR